MTFTALLGTLLLSLLPMIAMGEDSSPVDQSATAPSHKTHIYKQSIAFFEDQGPWKSGRDAAFAKWKSLKSQTIDYKIAPGQLVAFLTTIRGEPSLSSPPTGF